MKIITTHTQKETQNPTTKRKGQTPQKTNSMEKKSKTNKTIENLNRDQSEHRNTSKDDKEPTIDPTQEPKKDKTQKNTEQQNNQRPTNTTNQPNNKNTNSSSSSSSNSSTNTPVTAAKEKPKTPKKRNKPSKNNNQEKHKRRKNETSIPINHITEKEPTQELLISTLDKQINKNKDNKKRPHNKINNYFTPINKPRSETKTEDQTKKNKPSPKQIPTTKKYKTIRKKNQPTWPTMKEIKDINSKIKGNTLDTQTNKQKVRTQKNTKSSLVQKRLPRH